jgi:carbonic anhydrase
MSAAARRWRLACGVLLIGSKGPSAMSQIQDREFCADDTAAEGELVLPSTKCFAILACMDARMDAAKLTGRPGSHAHVIRNPGARASDDAIRSLVLSYELLGTREWFVVQHSQCGMALLNDELVHELLSGGAGLGATRGDIQARRGHTATRSLDVRDQAQSVLADVARIRNHPLVPQQIPIFGYIYRVETGRFVEVRQAHEVSASDYSAASKRSSSACVL